MLSLDRLNTYGLEFRAKLNQGKGVIPYLMLGGGYLNVQSNYQGAAFGLGAQSTGFANAGLGLDIPLGRNVVITGGAKAMATSSRDITDVTGPDVLQTHVMYSAGIKFQIGKKPEDPDDVSNLQENKLDQLESEMSSKDQEEYKRVKALIADYNKELRRLDEEINAAYEEKNTQKALDLLEEKKRVSEELRDVEKLERMYKRNGVQAEGEYLKMTPEEFENLIDRILKGIDEKYETETSETPKMMQSTENAVLLKEILELRNEIEKQNAANLQEESDIIKQKNAKKAQKDSIASNAKAEKELDLILEKNSKRQKEMDKRMQELDQRIEDFNKQLETQQKEVEAKKSKTDASSEKVEEVESKEVNAMDSNSEEKKAESTDQDVKKKSSEDDEVETEDSEDEDSEKTEYFF